MSSYHIHRLVLNGVTANEIIFALKMSSRESQSSDSLVKLHIFQIKRSLALDQKRHHGREHS